MAEIAVAENSGRASCARRSTRRRPVSGPRRRHASRSDGLRVCHRCSRGADRCTPVSWSCRTFSVDVPRELKMLPQVAAALGSGAPTGSATGRNFSVPRSSSAWATVKEPAGRSSSSSRGARSSRRCAGRSGAPILLLLAFAAGAAALALLLAHRLVRPIKRMQVAAAAIGAGALRGADRARPPRRARRPRAAFNRMAASLQELITGLEWKVAERTREPGDREQAQVGLPREHVPRAPDPAQRDRRLLPGAAGGALRRAQRQAEATPRPYPSSGQPPAVVDQRHPRPFEGRGRPRRARGGRVLAARGARPGNPDGAGEGAGERCPARAPARIPPST